MIIALAIKALVPLFDHTIHTLAIKDWESEPASHRRALCHVSASVSQSLLEGLPL